MTLRREFGPTAGTAAGCALTVAADDIYSAYRQPPTAIAPDLMDRKLTSANNRDMRSRRASQRLPGCLLLAISIVSGCATGVPKTDGPSEATPAAVVAAPPGMEENLKLDPAVRADFDAALELLNAGKYERGIELLTRVTQQAPRSTAPYINLAIAQQSTGKLDAAEENLKKALAIDPNHPVANNEYGILYRRTGRFAEARKTYERVIDRYPAFIPARKNLAILCDLYVKDFDCALKNYQIVSDASPNDKAVQTWIADVKARAGH